MRVDFSAVGLRGCVCRRHGQRALQPTACVRNCSLRVVEIEGHRAGSGSGARSRRDQACGAPINPAGSARQKEEPGRKKRKGRGGNPGQSAWRTRGVFTLYAIAGAANDGADEDELWQTLDPQWACPRPATWAPRPGPAQVALSPQDTELGKWDERDPVTQLHLCHFLRDVDEPVGRAQATDEARAVAGELVDGEAVRACA